MTVTDTEIIDSLIESFPGLVDGESEVSGADLVEELSLLLSRRAPQGTEAA